VRSVICGALACRIFQLLSEGFRRFAAAHPSIEWRRHLEVAVVLIPLFTFCWFRVRRQLVERAGPAYLRARGVIVVSERALQERAAPIGEYLGHPIWGSVRFMGMEYRFARIVDPRVRSPIAPRELLLAPGRVYVTD
jgi:hypothetical protein